MIGLFSIILILTVGMIILLSKNKGVLKGFINWLLYPPTYINPKNITAKYKLIRLTRKGPGTYRYLLISDQTHKYEVSKEIYDTFTNVEEK